MIKICAGNNSIVKLSIPKDTMVMWIPPVNGLGVAKPGKRVPPDRTGDTPGQEKGHSQDKGYPIHGLCS